MELSFLSQSYITFSKIHLLSMEEDATDESNARVENKCIAAKIKLLNDVQCEWCGTWAYNNNNNNGYF